MLSRMISFRIDKAIDDKMNDLAIRLGMTKGQVIRYAIEQLYNSIHHGRNQPSRGSSEKSS